MSQSSGIGGVLKGLAIIIAILGFIAGIMMGYFVEVVSSSGDFSWPIALSSWLVSAVLCALIYAIGEITNQLSAIRQSVESIAVGQKAFIPSTTAQVKREDKESHPFVKPLQDPPLIPVSKPNEPINQSQSDEKWVTCLSCGQTATSQYAKIRKVCPKCGVSYDI